MAEPRIAHRYAKSLLDLAREQKSLDAVFADMELVLKAINESRDFSVLLKSPVISTDKKLAILKEIFSANVSTISLSFLVLLANKKREKYIHEIASSFVAQYKADKGIKIAEVSTPVALSEEAKKKILEIVIGKTGLKVELVEKIKPELIGGFILRVDDNQVDNSISSQINLLKRDFSKNLYVKDF